ncbi:MAG: PHB depolymerase family esterase [Acidimicrobiia bacterium]|nr:PHB depolymerase family esterase [Acidimicrobiia bacterium]
MRTIVRLTAVIVLAGLAAACSGDDPAATTNSPNPTTATTAAPTTSPTTTVPATTPTTTVPPTTMAMRASVDELITIEFDGRERRYHLFIPGGFPETPAPLVVDIHPALSTPNDQEALSGMRIKAAEEGFIVAQPAGQFRSWDIITGNGNDVAFIRAVVADVQSRTPIDVDRIYATGMSNGGGLTDQLACTAGDLFAAAAPVAGWYVPSVECPDDAVVPVMAFHGTDDFVVPYDGMGLFFVDVEEWAAEWAARNGCAAEPTDERITEDVVKRTWAGCDADTHLFTIEGGAHGWPGSDVSIIAVSSTNTISATDLIWDFFVANPKA